MNHKNLFLILMFLTGFACSQQKSPKIFEQTKNYPEELQQLHKNVLTNLLDDEIDAEEINEIYNMRQLKWIQILRLLIERLAKKSH